jgi:cysteinyl-tRNA synthetase
VDDAEDGEDKIAKKARLENLWKVQRYTVDFHEIFEGFNFLPPSIEPTATVITLLNKLKSSTIIDKVEFNVANGPF